MRFSEVYGMDKVKQELRAMADAGQVPHALLLHGPQGVGKMRLARAFVQYLGCQHRAGGDSCGVCPSCQQTSKFNNPDIHYVYPVVKRSSPTMNISTDYLPQWREMLEKYSYMPPERWLDLLEAGNSQPMIYVNESEEMLRVASLSAYGSRYKIFLVWLPEKLNPEAANKLLKLIEEPFPDTLFVMVSNDSSSILPTVFSRLRRIAVPPFQEAEVMAWLGERGVAGDDALRIARIAGGNLAKAGELASAAGETAEFSSFFIDTMRGAYARNIVALRRLADSAAALGRERSMRLLSYFGRMVRENFIYNLRVPALTAMTREEEAFSGKFSPFIHSGNVEAIADEVSRAFADISRNANAKIVWFDFMLQLLRLLRVARTA